jgi:hypothetical protein
MSSGMTIFFGFRGEQVHRRAASCECRMGCLSLKAVSASRCHTNEPHAIAWAGRLSCGSLLTQGLRQSAIRQSFVAGRPAAASAPQRALASQRTAARSRGIRHRCLALELGLIKLERIEAVTTYVLRHRPKSSKAEALHRLLRIRQNLWQ